MSKRTLIVIPALNEEKTITAAVLNCNSYGDVLVVDDGSDDNTSVLAQKAGAIVISNKKNLGYEYSLNVGHSYALNHDYQIMLTMDADGQLPYSQIPEFIGAIEKGAAVAIGKRNNIPRLSEKLLAKFSILFSDIYDPYCGMKAYDLTANRQSYFSQYNSIGTAFALDYRALNLSLENIKIEIKDRNGESKFGGRLTSELRLAPSVFLGIIRLLYGWFSLRCDRLLECWRRF